MAGQKKHNAKERIIQLPQINDYFAAFRDDSLSI